MEKNILALVFFSSKQRERDEREREERRVLESWRFLLAEGLRE